MTPARLIKRLSAMDGRELRFRTSSFVRQVAERTAFAVRRPAWQRSTISTLLDPVSPEIERAIDHARRNEWAEAHRALMRSVETGGCRFVLDPRRRQEIVALIDSAFPTAVRDAGGRADRILAGRFDLLGYRGLSFVGGSGSIDWQFDPVHNRRPPRVFWSRVPYLAPECGDHKIIWELNRHQHWMTLGRAHWLTGDRRPRERFIDELGGWLEANPPLEGMNWASMLELGLRSISWIWALHFFAGAGSEHERPWTIDLLVGLDRQLSLVERNLSLYFSPNTHLLGEALALYVAGRTLPLRRAPGWAALGRSVLVNEIARQINGDGGHVELSTHYHRYTLDFYLLALAVATSTGDPAAAEFSAAVRRLAAFARTMADDRGILPAIGDEDGGSLLPLCGRAPADAADSLQLAARFLDQPELAAGAPAEEVVWMTGELPDAWERTQAWPSTALRNSGYFVSRPGTGDHLVIDAGPHGFLNGGHAHADALSITLSVGSRPLLVDPGTGCYTIDLEVRDRFRSTALHNTVTLDGRPQSEPDGPFHWRSAARARAIEWRSADGADYFAGEHDGYAPVIHGRTVLSRAGSWTIEDCLSQPADGSTDGGSRQMRRMDVHWHIDPAWRVVAVNGHAARATHADGTSVWIVAAGDALALEVFHGSAAQRTLGWHSPVYGALEPAATVRVTTEGPLPLRLTTLIATSVEPPALERATDTQATLVGA
jgi:hypothetical protein